MNAGPLELWGGLQHPPGASPACETAGGPPRWLPEHFESFRALGLRTLRIPLLWEAANDVEGAVDPAWNEAWAARLRDLDVRPVLRRAVPS